jgi:hydroxyacylglutathione hydrolase
MEIKKLTVGPLKTNCYIAHNPETNKGVIIDPGSEAEKIIKEAKGLDIVYILNTHGHFDHIAANREIKKYFGAKIAIGKTDAPMLTSSAKNYSSVLGFGKIKSPKADLLLRNKQALKVDNLKIEVISVPGHSPGGVAFLIDNHLFPGDILFKGAYGLTLKEKDYKRLKKGIQEKLFILPEDTIVHPGHGLDTTIGQEKKHKL